MLLFPFALQIRVCALAIPINEMVSSGVEVLLSWFALLCEQLLHKLLVICLHFGIVLWRCEKWRSPERDLKFVDLPKSKAIIHFSNI